MNARAWGFHGIGAGCGVDFPYLLFAQQLGLPTEPVHAKAGIGWLRLLTDIPTAMSDLKYGSLSVGEYLRTLRATRVESVFNWKDPLPSVAEFVLLPYVFAKKLPTTSR